MTEPFDARTGWIPLPTRRLLSVRLEFKAQDCWVGIYWQRHPNLPDWFDVWVCLLPMLPIHVQGWLFREPRRRP